MEARGVELTQPVGVTEEVSEMSLPSVWPYPNDPAKFPGHRHRLVKPVTWEDIGGVNSVHTIGLREFEIEILDMEEVPEEQVRFSRITEAMFQAAEGRARLRTVNLEKTLDLFTQTFDFGDAIAPWMSFLWTENYKEVIDEIHRRQLIVANVAGHVPFLTPPVPAPAVEYAKEVLGARFLGMDNGEHDCRFVLGACDKIYEKPGTLEQGYENFIDYEYRIQKHIGCYAVTLSNNTFQHYLADIPYTRMLGCQICESKPNIALWHAILRGAGKQYGLLWWTAPAEWNLWGTKAYLGEPWGSPMNGTSLALLRRAWLLTYMYGSAFIMGQYAYFMKDDASDALRLSPVGQRFMQEKAFIRSHPNRGVQHVPIAMIWNFHEGYVTGKHAPLRTGPYQAWGNIPYTKGHYQIDAINDAFYPDMAESGFWRNERGYLGATPCGDQVDVLFDNVPRSVLQRYNAALVLGNVKIAGQFLDTVSDFIRAGGSVATTISQLTEESYRAFGIATVIGEKKTITAELEDMAFNEAEFSYWMVQLDPEVEIVARTYEGDPLAYRMKTAFGGSLLVFLSDYGISDQVCCIPIDCPTESILPRPFLLLEHVRSLLLAWCHQWDLIQVRGTHGVQWFTNIMEDEAMCIATIVNNESTTWHGDVRLIHGTIAGGENWMDDSLIPSGKSVELTIKPHDMVILRILGTSPMMVFKENSAMPEEDCMYDLRSKQIMKSFEQGLKENRAMKIVYDKTI